MHERAKVISIQGNKALLSCATSACTGCKGELFCNIKERTFWAPIPKNITIFEGSEVEIYLPTGKTIQQSFTTLILPLLFFVGGYLIVRLGFKIDNELWQAVGGFGAMGVGFFSLFLYNRLTKKEKTVEIVSVYAEKK